MSEPYGIIGVFDRPEAAQEAAQQLRNLGFRDVEAYTPYYVEGLRKILHPQREVFLPLLMFAGALLGAAWGYFIEYWDEVWDYPLNVGGRPHNSWPAFIVGDFEFTLLVTIYAGLFGLILWGRLMRLYHPIFNAEHFARASQDRFVLCVETRDPAFEPATIRRVFERHGAEQVEEVTE